VDVDVLLDDGQQRAHPSIPPRTGATGRVVRGSFAGAPSVRWTAVPVRLVEREPVVAPVALVEALVPPPLFAAVSFDSYVPDPAEPTQAAALAAVRAVAAQLAQPATRRRGLRRLPASRPPAIYLDGGFGVGKTHLLASLWHAAPAPKAYTTFVELTHLCGALGFAAARDALSSMRLLAVDEFELDDPGDTVLVSTLLAQLADAGVALAATSNTLPDRLGEGRFAADEFLREIQGLATRFTTVRVDGPDYRHRGLPAAPAPRSDAEVIASAENTRGASLDEWDSLVEHLSRLHPSRYGALVDGVAAVHLRHVATLHDQNAALRLVVLVDRLYDRQVPVLASGAALDDVFDSEMLAGGYRKKYRRAISRLVALNRIAGERLGHG
jgi:cell division protein ZapE